MTNQYNYSSDSPVKNQEEDRFSRWTFSARIAQVITERSDPSSIIIGLNGTWGDGKTSVLNFIERSLNDTTDVICIKFNPWRFGTEEELLSGFFSDIAESLDSKLMTKGDEFKGILKKLAPGAAAMVGAKGAGDSVASFISGPTIDELKKRIECELKKAKKRVLILVDDIDRLDKNEIHALFRIVKLTADFKYTSYILAFDQDVVAASLQERYAGASSDSGHSFLEKIIQVPLHLPSVEKSVLRDFCYEGINEAMRMSKIDLSEQQVQEFTRDFTGAFDDCLTTPRKAKLYGNILLFSLPILAGEVNPVDFMLIEAIRIFYPNLYDTIRNNKDMLTGSSHDSHHTNHDLAKDAIKGILNSALTKDVVVNQDGVLSLMKNLFPKLESVYGNSNYGSEWESNWSKAQRVCATNYFARYFNYSIPRGDIADKEIIYLLEICEVDDVSQDNSARIQSLFTKDNAENLIHKLRNKASNISEKASLNLAHIIAINNKNFPNPNTLFNFQVPFVQAAILIGDLTQNIDNKEPRITAVKDCLKAADNIEFQLEIMRWLKKETDEKPNEDRFNEKDTVVIGKYLGELIKNYLGTGVDITLEHQNVCPIVLFTIKEYIDEQYLRDYIGGLLKADNQVILRLLESFTNTAWGMETGVSHKSDFEKNQYDNLIKAIDPDVVASKLELALGHLPEITSDYPYDFDGDRNLQLATQFLWLKNHVESEKAEPVKEESK